MVLAPGQPRVSQARHSAFARTICCDHLYFGAKLDAYALVSFLLGQTERIAGLVTVTSLPSRPRRDRQVAVFSGRSLR